MPARPTGDSAVSPVVGMVLVLAISVLGITGVLVWGLPAIQEMKASVEHQAIVTEFHELNADVKELAKATASKTAKLWRFSESQGDFAILANTERWVVGMDAKSTKGRVYNLTAYGLDDTDSKFVLVNHHATMDLPVTVRADYLEGSATIPLTVKYLAAAGDACATSQAIAPSVTIAKNGGARGFCLYTTGATPTDAPVKGRILQLEITHYAAAVADREIAARFWTLDAGRAQWTHAGTTGEREAYVSNGVVIQGTNGRLSLDGDPSIPPPAKQAGTWRFFGRLIAMNGSASIGGQGRIDVLLNLYGSRTLADEASSAAVKVWTFGKLGDTWDAYFLKESYGFAETTETGAGAPAGLKYLKYVPTGSVASNPTEIKLILHASVVTAKG